MQKRLTRLLKIAWVLRIEIPPENSDSVFVNASTWGLMLTGKVIGLADGDTASPVQAVNRLVNKLTEPVIRKAMHQAMKIMGHQFVLGRTIEEAQKMVARCAIRVIPIRLICWVKRR